MSELQKALEYIEKSLQIYKKINNNKYHPSIADSYNAIGVVCFNTG